jgi:IS6 family transposase
MVLYVEDFLVSEHVSELLAERGLSVDGSCVWRWVQAYSPELSKRCRQHLRATNKSYRVDETYSALSSVLLRRVEV